MYQHSFKRIIDFILSLIAIVILMPLFLILIALLAIQNRGSAFFFQERPGKGERIFRVMKFKTMNDMKDSEGNLLPDVSRLTPLGKFIRKTSLDELPQLLNVLKGDMSLIGPRPLLVEYLPYYSDQEKLRHTVRPGITGLAQVSGRNNLEWIKRLDLDAQYVKSITFKNDLRIFLLTIKKVIAQEDIIIAPGEKQLRLDEERKS